MYSNYRLDSSVNLAGSLQRSVDPPTMHVKKKKSEKNTYIKECVVVIDSPNHDNRLITHKNVLLC